MERYKLLILLSMFVSPAFIERSICDQLNIKSYKRCDNLCVHFVNWKLWQSWRTREEFGERYKCNPNKCICLIDTKYLKLNNCNVENELRLTRGHEKKIADLLHRDYKFIPHCIVSKIPCKRRKISRREVMYFPSEKLYSGNLFYI